MGGKDCHQKHPRGVARRCRKRGCSEEGFAICTISAGGRDISRPYGVHRKCCLKHCRAAIYGGRPSSRPQTACLPRWGRWPEGPERVRNCLAMEAFPLRRIGYALSAPVCELGQLSQRESQARARGRGMEDRGYRFFSLFSQNKTRPGTFEGSRPGDFIS